MLCSCMITRLGPYAEKRPFFENPHHLNLTYTYDLHMSWIYILITRPKIGTLKWRSTITILKTALNFAKRSIMLGTKKNTWNMLILTGD